MSKSRATAPKHQSGPLWLIICMLGLVLLAGATVRYYRLQNTPPDKMMADVITYIEIAQNLSLTSPFGGNYSTGPVVVWFDRIFIEVGDLIGLAPKRAVKYGTGFISLVTLALFFLWTRSLIGPWGALVAALFAAVNPLLAEMDISGGRDTPFMLWLNAFCFFAFTVKDPRLKSLGMGICGGFLCLTRINSLLVVFILGGLVLWRDLGKQFWRRWLKVMVITLLMTAPFIAAQWIARGDPFYSINSHAWWHSQIDPDSGRKVQSFAEFLLVDIGVQRLVIRTVEGAFNWLLGTEAHKAFFSSLSLPYALYLIPYLMYLGGIVFAVFRLRWEPFMVLLLVAGPVWPLSQARFGLDPRLLLFTVFFIGFCIGVCADRILGRIRLPLPAKSYYQSLWPWIKTGKARA